MQAKQKNPEREYSESDKRRQDADNRDEDERYGK